MELRILLVTLVDYFVNFLFSFVDFVFSFSFSVIFFLFMINVYFYSDSLFDNKLNNRN